MELFRSEEMQLVQLIVPAEAAHDTVSDLGEVGLMQFRDLNPDKSAFQRTYANQVRVPGKGKKLKRAPAERPMSCSDAQRSPRPPPGFFHFSVAPHATPCV